MQTNIQQTQEEQVQNPQQEEDEQQQMTLDQLKQSIHLSTTKLLQLTYSEEKFINTIIKFNTTAIQYIDQQQHEQSLAYLAQAQRTLQYGASCGKSIDRNLIICILNNESCCYYRQGQLIKCASYLQGVIYNLKAFAMSMQSTPTNSSLLQRTANKPNKTNTDQFYHISVEKKIQLICYNLKYCTINSQIGKVEIALKAGNNVIKLVKCLFDDILFQNPKVYPSNVGGNQGGSGNSNINSNVNGMNGNNVNGNIGGGSSQVSVSSKPQKPISSEILLSAQNEISQLKQFIKTQMFFKQEIDPQNFLIYRRLTRIYIKKWNQKKLTSRINRSFEKHIQNYSLSQVIEILPIQYNSDADKLYENLVNTKNILRQLLHLAMGYFTISTQHRLLAEKRYPHMSLKDEKQNSQEWKLANIFHLFSILILGVNLNSDLLFLKQLINSYEQHYKYEILKDEQMSDQQLQSLSEKLLFEVRKSKMTKQSELLLQKISKIKQKQNNNKSKSKDQNGEYKTLNSSKLNISKQITPKVGGRKRSISSNKKQQIPSALSSSKHMSQKTSLNTSTLNKTKQLNESTEKQVTRKRSYSKDSVKQTSHSKLSKPTIGHLGVQKFNKVQQRTINQYQLGTPDKKLTTKVKRKRISSSVSSTKQILKTGSTQKKQRSNSKNGKVFQFNGNSGNNINQNHQKDNHQKQPKLQRQKQKQSDRSQHTHNFKSPSNLPKQPGTKMTSSTTLLTGTTNNIDKLSKHSQKQKQKQKQLLSSATKNIKKKNADVMMVDKEKQKQKTIHLKQQKKKSSKQSGR